MDDKNEFKGMRATVMGLGTFGGGLGSARFLAEHGARVTVTDTKSPEQLAASVTRLSDLDIRFVLGGHAMEDFTSADIVVASPAVPRTSKFIDAARNTGARLTTEIELFVDRCPSIICGITGSNGKSTTVSMLGSILESDGRKSWVGGNIGGSLLAALPEMGVDDIVVLELSSFQLEWLRDTCWSPHIAAVLNILPNHLDRHGTIGDYTEAKAAILDNQSTDDRVVLVRDDPGSRSLCSRSRGKILWVSAEHDIPGIVVENGMILERRYRTVTPIIRVKDLNIIGNHMITNALVATACAVTLECSLLTIKKGLRRFSGLPHRLEFVGEVAGVRFVNDSKATTPDAAAAAAEAFDGKVIPILGGYDKEVTFTGMAARMAKRIQWAALIGQTAPMITGELNAVGVKTSVFATLEEAFDACVARASWGSTVLLSPGCASYDMFRDYEERGELFKACVRRLIGEKDE